MAESTKNQDEEEKITKKNLSSHDDDDENQVEKPLLDTPKTEVKQPKKKKMPLFKKKAAADQAVTGGGDASMFDVTLEQLNEIMEVRGKDLMEKLNSSDFNGVKGLLEKLKVDGNKGLDGNNEQDLEQRRVAYGRNEIPPKPMKSFLKLCWEAFHDMLLVILLVCAVVSIGLSFYKPPQEEGAQEEEEANLEWIEGVAILAAVLVVVLVTAFNDWRKERQFRGLQDKIEKDQQTSVVRNDHVQQIPVSELVVGDLCFIKYGDLLPADGLIVQASDLKIDESSITGETDLVKKSEKEDVGLLSGTNVMEGSGRMLVVGVGLNSQVGRIMSLLGATGGDKKKGKKGKKGKKDKNKDEKDDKKKEKKIKPKSSTKVSPDTSKPDDNENESQTVHTENETKSNPRIKKLPPLQQSNDDKQETESPKKENTNNEQKKSSNDNQQTKKESNAGDNGDNEKDKMNQELQKKKSGSSTGSGDKSEKKPVKSENSDDDEETKKKEDLQKKKSSSSEGSNKKPEEKPDDEEQTKKVAPKPELEKKKSSSSEGSNKKSEEKPDGDDEQKKKVSTKPDQEKKKSNSDESSDDEETKKKEDLQKKKSSSSEGSNKKSEKKPVEEEKKKSSPTENSDNEDEKKSSSNGDKKLTKTKSTDKKSNKSEDSDDDDEKKSKQGNNQPTTNSSAEKKDSDSDKKDSEKKPAGLAALAENADDDDDGEGESKDSKHKSVLQTKLTRLALVIGYIGMSAAVLTLICLIVRFCITTYVVKKQAGKASDVTYFVSFLIQAITVVVVSVPEGLPLAVTLALAYAVRKMMTDNNLVRHLDACETMGNASTICSDKTGTLTTNRMTVVQCYITGKHFDKLPKKEDVNKDLLPVFFEAVTVNSNYTSKIEKSKDEQGLPKQVGNKTECALLGLIEQWGGSYDEIRKNIPQEKLAKVFTFNSARKMMSTIIQREEGYRIYTKGASEMVLTKCKHILGEDNQPKDLNDDEKKKITHDIIEKMANDGLRTICIAYRDLGKEEQDWGDDDQKFVEDLVCIAIVGIEDPVRDEVPEAIEKCQKAGVIVRMVTGDNIMTARSIATKCGIIKPEDDFLVLEGKEFNKKIRDSSGKISQKKLDEIWPKLRVLARSSPTDKYNLVNGIVESQATQHREVVAVTGDGTNDGPALKRADVGFAMGIQGTDVAKQASDIILTDDNFSSIVKAMMWGRNVYDCIAKFLQFQLTANLSAGVISVVSAAAISSVPLRAIQMLWVNLVMDTLASLALATEPPTDDLLNRKPYGRTKSIISPLMLRNILGQSIYQLVIMFIILYAGQYFLGVDSTVQAIQSDPHAGRAASAQFTMVFNAFVLMTLFNEINSRKLHGERNVFKGIFTNPFFYVIWISCFIAQILIVTFGDKVFSCVRLDIKQWAWSLLFGVGSLIWQQILLFIPIEPFSKCFSAVYRVCCPCLYKKTKKDDEEDEGRKTDKGEKSDDDDDEEGEKLKKKRTSKKTESDDEIGVDNKDDNEARRRPRPSNTKYGTIGQLTNATVVVQPPPVFARFMLRKSVERLNTEFRVINEFRSRLEKVKENRNDDSTGSKRNSQDKNLDE